LTFCMSTFWLNSGGNLVALTRRASTLAMAALAYGSSGGGGGGGGGPPGI
jgi:hypothetical protein